MLLRFFFKVFFMLYFHKQSQFGFRMTFFHPHEKPCQTFKVLQYSFVVFVLSENQTNTNFFLKREVCVPAKHPSYSMI